jgi:hypothetical protein
LAAGEQHPARSVNLGAPDEPQRIAFFHPVVPAASRAGEPKPAARRTGRIESFGVRMAECGAIEHAGRSSSSMAAQVRSAGGPLGD